MSCVWPADQTPAYLFFFLCQLGLEEVNVGQGPLQTQLFVRDGGLQLRHLGFQLTLSRLLTEGNSSVNKRQCSHAPVGWGCKMISGFYHMLWWDEGARWSVVSFTTSAWSVWKEGCSFNFIPFPPFCSFHAGHQPSTTRTKVLWGQRSEKQGTKAVTGRPFGLQQWDFVKKQNKRRKQKPKNKIIGKCYKWKSHESIPRQKDQRIQNHPTPVVAALIFRIVTDLV